MVLYNVLKYFKVLVNKKYVVAILRSQAQLWAYGFVNSKPSG